MPLFNPYYTNNSALPNRHTNTHKYTHMQYVEKLVFLQPHHGHYIPHTLHCLEVYPGIVLVLITEVSLKYYRFLSLSSAHGILSFTTAPYLWLVDFYIQTNAVAIAITMYMLLDKTLLGGHEQVFVCNITQECC